MVLVAHVVLIKALNLSSYFFNSFSQQIFIELVQWEEHPSMCWGWWQNVSPLYFNGAFFVTLFIHSFIQSMDKYSWGTCWVPGTISDTRAIQINQTCPQVFTDQHGREVSTEYYGNKKKGHLNGFRKGRQKDLVPTLEKWVISVKEGRICHLPLLYGESKGFLK